LHVLYARRASLRWRSEPVPTIPNEAAVQDRIAILERQVRVFQGLTLALVAAVAVLGLAGAAQDSKPSAAPRRVERFDEITVGRLNIAGPDGVNRIILAHTMPQAPFQGELLERSVPPGLAGMIYCAPNGDEVGGIGVSGTPDGGHALITLDYRDTPLEAIGLATHYSTDRQSAALVVMHNPGGAVDIKKIKAADQAEIEKLQAMMVQRVELGVAEHNASLVLRDRKGNTRVVIGVDAANNAELKILDESGKEVARLPAK
jgi:hypothetical protein